MKKLFIMLSVMLLTGFIFAEEQTGEEPQFQNAEEVKENAEAAQTDLKKETEPQKEEDKKRKRLLPKRKSPYSLKKRKTNFLRGTMRRDLNWRRRNLQKNGTSFR